MANLVSQIHPLDSEDDVAIGLGLPISSDKTSFFKLNYTTKEQATTNLKMLLLTIPGERVMRPDFGTNIRRILFEPDSSDLVLNVGNEIEEKVELWLPNIAIKDVKLKKNSDKHIIFITIKYALVYNIDDEEDIVIELDNII